MSKGSHKNKNNAHTNLTATPRSYVIFGNCNGQNLHMNLIRDVQK